MNTLKAKWYVWALGASLMATLSSCEDNFIRGRGDVLSETRTVSTFDAVEVHDDIEVYLTQGPAEDIRVEGQGNVLDVLQTKVENRELEIKFKNFVNVGRHEPVRVYITNPVLTSLQVSGSGRAEGRTDWKVKNLELRISGSGRMDLNVIEATGLNSRISGSGSMNISGDCASHDIEISGSGNVRAFDLTARTSDTRISGSGNCELTVTDNLIAKVSGSGNVRYRGNPSVSVNISGSGKVTRVD